MWSHGCCTWRVGATCKGCTKLDAQFGEIKDRIKALRGDLDNRGIKLRSNNDLGHIEDYVNGDAKGDTKVENWLDGTKLPESEPSGTVLDAEALDQAIGRSTVEVMEEKEEDAMEVRQDPKHKLLVLPVTAARPTGAG